MRTVAEIKQDILALTEAEYADLCRWVHGPGLGTLGATSSTRTFETEGWTVWRQKRWRPRPEVN